MKIQSGVLLALLLTACGESSVSSRPPDSDLHLPDQTPADVGEAALKKEAAGRRWWRPRL
jgi:hypothetical protein